MTAAADVWIAVHKAIYDAISTAVSGVASVYDSVPQDASYPYVDLAAQNVRANDTVSTVGYSFEFYPAIYSQHLGTREVRTTIGLINEALHNANLTLTIGHSVRCRVTEEKCLREPDGRTYQGGMTIELFVVI